MSTGRAVRSGECSSSLWLLHRRPRRGFERPTQRAPTTPGTWPRVRRQEAASREPRHLARSSSARRRSALAALPDDDAMPRDPRCDCAHLYATGRGSGHAPRSPCHGLERQRIGTRGRQRRHDPRARLTPSSTPRGAHDAGVPPGGRQLRDCVHHRRLTSSEARSGCAGRAPLSLAGGYRSREAPKSSHQASRIHAGRQWRSAGTTGGAWARRPTPLLSPRLAAATDPVAALRVLAAA